MPEVVYYAGRWYVHVASAFPPVRIPKRGGRAVVIQNSPAKVKCNNSGVVYMQKKTNCASASDCVDSHALSRLLVSGGFQQMLT